MALKLITPPTIEPVTLDEVKEHCRIDSAEDDNFLNNLITVARQEAEKITRRQLITATWELRLDHFPGGCFIGSWSGDYSVNKKLVPGRNQSDTIYLPMPPLQSVTPIAPVVIGGVKYLDSAGVEKTLVENTDYMIDIYSEPGRITPCYGMVWPVTYQIPNAVRIVYKAGYGDTAASVPESIRSWIKAVVGTLYENRETVFVAPNTVNMVKLDFLDGLLDNYRVFGME